MCLSQITKAQIQTQKPIIVRQKLLATQSVPINSMGTSFIGSHPFKRVFGKPGETKLVTITTTEKEFGAELNIYLKDFKPNLSQQVN